jgi:hypothetical protein
MPITKGRRGDFVDNAVSDFLFDVKSDYMGGKMLGLNRKLS